MKVGRVEDTARLLARRYVQDLDQSYHQRLAILNVYYAVSRCVAQFSSVASIWTQHRHPYEEESIGSAFVRRTKEVNRSTTLRTPDPTSVEFRDIFVRILDDALLGDRRLVIVVDNLDRIPSQEEALSVWSTMRAFFDPSGHTDRSWMARFWLLVPFDSNAMTELWSPGGKSDGRLGGTFLDKTFQVTFRVPPPVLTVWRDFMRDQLTKAFPDHPSEDDFSVIYRLFRRQAMSEGKPLTPRSIKVFINKVGALHRQWGDDIPLPVQGLYALHEQEIAQDPETTLRNGTFLNQGVLDLLGQEEWQRHLAALYYNVDPEIAIQILIGASVEQALVSGNSAKLKELQTVTGFVEVCERIIEDGYQAWPAEEPMSLARAALAIDDIESGSESDWEQSWRWLCRSASQVDDWHGMNEDGGKGIVAILRHREVASDEDLAEKVLKALGQWSSDDVHEAPGQWLRGALQIVKYLRKYDRGSLLTQHFRVPGSAAFYISVMKTIAEMNIPHTVGAYFSPLVEVASVEADFVRRVNEGEWEEADTAAVSYLRDVRGVDGVSWEGLHEALQQRLQQGPGIDPQQILACSRALLLMAYDGVPSESENTVEHLCSQGYMMSHLYDMQTAADFEATAVCLLSIVDFYPVGTVQNVIMNAQAGHSAYSAITNDPGSHPDIVEAFAREVWHFNRLEAMLARADEAPNVKALLLATVRTLAEREDAYEQFAPQLVVRRYDLLAEALADEAFDRLVGQLVEHADLLSILEDHAFSPELARLYVTALQKAEDLNKVKRLADFLIANLQEVTEDQWLTALETESGLLRLVMYLVERGYVLDLSENFHDALRSHLEKVHDEELSVDLQLNWDQITRALRSDWQETFFRDLRDFLIANSNRQLSPVLSLYGQPLSELQIVSESGKADDMVRKLFTAIVEGEAVEELKWLAATLENHPEIIERCANASRRVLADRVRDALSDGTKPDDHMAALKRIGKVLRVRGRKKNP